MIHRILLRIFMWTGSKLFSIISTTSRDDVSVEGILFTNYGKLADLYGEIKWPVEPKSWRLCEKCGDKYFPHCNKKLWGGITVSNGKCPECGKKATLIPISDFKNVFD